jgi:hypothetical protein
MQSAVPPRSTPGFLDHGHNSTQRRSSLGICCCGGHWRCVQLPVKHGNISSRLVKNKGWRHQGWVANLTEAAYKYLEIRASAYHLFPVITRTPSKGWGRGRSKDAHKRTHIHIEDIRSPVRLASSFSSAIRHCQRRKANSHTVAKTMYTRE